MNKFILSGVLALIMSGLPPSSLARDLTTFQAALRVAQDEMIAAKAEHDADARRVAATEKEVERLKKQLEAEQKKAEQSEKRYAESRAQYDRAQAAFDQAWKK